MNIQYLLTSLVIILVPGTGVLYTINTGLTLKWKAGVAAAFGCTLGIIPHIAASVLGLSALLHMSARIFSVLKFAGAAYLLYLSWKMWRDAGEGGLEGKDEEKGFFRIVGKAVVINLLNPKLTIFFFAFLPLFVPEGTVSPTREMVVLGLGFMAMTFAVFAVYGILAGLASAWLTGKRNALKWFRKTCAAMIAVFAVKLALTENR